jgi:hypothetical protein
VRRLLLALALVACSNPTVPDPIENGDVGHYDLVSIDGRRPPRPTSYGVYYWRGSIELFADSTFVDVIVLGNAERATTIDSVFGTWRAQGDSLRMTPAGWTPYSIRRQFETIRVQWDGAFVYRRSP